MQLQQSGSPALGYSPSAATAASGSNPGNTSQATARKLLLGSVWSALGLSGPTGSVQDIASALSSALSTGLASGQDLAPQLTQTVDQALDKVSQQLQAQGVSPTHVAKLVAKFRQDLADAVSSAAASAGGAGVTSVTSAFAAVRERESLTIQTTDGAQVTIRFGAQAAAGANSSAAALFASSKMQIEVSGNLSSADLTAISNVVSQVDSIANDFFSGDVQDAFAAAANVNADPSEIAGFSLQMSYSAALYQQAASGANPATTNSVPPVVTSPATTAQTTTDAATAANTSTTTPTAATPANSATPQQTIANFLQSTLAKLTVTSNASGTTRSARWGVQLLAVVLPAYAQTQSSTGSQASGQATPTSTATSPAVTQVANTTPTQAAHLAAATLVQLIN
jgi:hypothetical protein